MGRTVYYDHNGNEVDPPKADTVKLSNADRIRAMTDEELAEFIADDLIEPGYNTREKTVKMWLDWLKEEATE